MLVTDDIEKILLKSVKEMRIGMAVPVIYRKGTELPFEDKRDTTERIIINVISLTNDVWSKGYANVNIFIPNRKDLDYETANHVRLGDIQRAAAEDFKGVLTGVLDGLRYICKMDGSPKIEEDKSLWGYFVNVRLKFKIQNF